MVVVPYLHQASHNLKNIGKRVAVDIVFSAPLKLSGLCMEVNNTTQKCHGCNKEHRQQFVSCVEAVVYCIPLCCGNEYVGQTGRCLNDRLREHSQNAGNLAKTGHLSTHCSRCGCKPLFNRSKVISRNTDQVTREIIDGLKMIRSNNSVSWPSVSLLRNEILFLPC